jgi:hypothetical protein
VIQGGCPKLRPRGWRHLASPHSTGLLVVDPKYGTALIDLANDPANTVARASQDVLRWSRVGTYHRPV